MTSLGEYFLGLNWKCPLLPFNYPQHLQSRVLVISKVHVIGLRFQIKLNQNFCEKRLIRPVSKYPNWQRSQPISYKANFSKRDNVFLMYLKCNITCQNIWGGPRSDQCLYHERPKMAKKLPNNLHGWAFYKIANFVLTKQSYQKLTTISITKVWSGPKVNPQFDKDLNP